MGEMLAECRCAACLLGDTDRDPALGLVRDRERRFFFFSCGLLEEKRVRAEAAPAGGLGLRTARTAPACSLLPEAATLDLTRNR